eukprot:COSAG04_NODE_2421_length_4154_cov_2.113194_3_plen_266_part_00
MAAVQCLQGDAVWSAGRSGLFSPDLALAACAAVKGGSPTWAELEGFAFTEPEPAAAWLIEYRDGFRATLLLLNGFVSGNGYAACVRGEGGESRIEESAADRLQAQLDGLTNLLQSSNLTSEVAQLQDRLAKRQESATPEPAPKPAGSEAEPEAEPVAAGEVQCQFKGKGKWEPVWLSLEPGAEQLTFKAGGAEGTVLRTASVEGCKVSSPKTPPQRARAFPADRPQGWRRGHGGREEVCRRRRHAGGPRTVDERARRPTTGRIAA